MRRKDRKKDADFALEVLRDCEYATLATVNEDGTPYCIPISPVLVDGCIYFHCALEGKKLDNINQNPNVCVSCVRHTKLVPEKFTTELKVLWRLANAKLYPMTKKKYQHLGLFAKNTQVAI